MVLTTMLVLKSTEVSRIFRNKAGNPLVANRNVLEMFEICNNMYIDGRNPF